MYNVCISERYPSFMLYSQKAAAQLVKRKALPDDAVYQGDTINLSLSELGQASLIRRTLLPEEGQVTW